MPFETSYLYLLIKRLRLSLGSIGSNEIDIGWLINNGEVVKLLQEEVMGLSGLGYDAKKLLVVSGWGHKS